MPEIATNENIIKTVQHYGMCMLCKNDCKNKYNQTECDKFEWILDIEKIF